MSSVFSRMVSIIKLLTSFVLEEVRPSILSFLEGWL